MSVEKQVDGDTRQTADQYLTFILADEEYGVDILEVQEIKGWIEATRVPNTRDYVRGVINLRGAVVPIVDLRRRFGLEPVEAGPTTVIIVMRLDVAGHERTMGFVADAVSDIYDVDVEAVKPSEELSCAIDTNVIRGFVTIEQKMIILLNMTRLVEEVVEETADVAA